MARHNASNLYGQVIKEPAKIMRKDGSGIDYIMVHIKTLRGVRKVENDVDYLRYDKILILTKDEKFFDEIGSWHVNDMVEVKGTFNTKSVTKPSYCSNEECPMSKRESGGNKKAGTLCYVTPINADRVRSFTDNKDCLDDLKRHQEVSNQIYVLGTLCREPKKIKVKARIEGKPGITLTQYQIALDRKYRIQSDPPEIRTDYPWVKSYGKMGKEDRMRLHTGSVVFIDGYIQRRKVEHRTVCPCCGQSYLWKDDNLEIVPYDIEYMPHTYFNDTDLEELAKTKPEEVRQRIYYKEYEEKFDDVEDGMSTNVI